MNDDRKFRIAMIVTVLLVVCTISFPLFQEYVMVPIGDYLQRRFYYERVISKKGMSLHRGEYWRQKE